MSRPSKFVHRPLILATPIERGPDVRRLQLAINRQYEHLRIDRFIRADGEFGRVTFGAARQVALSLGVVDQAQHKLERGRVSKGTQRLIRGSRQRTPEEIRATERRKGYREDLRRRYRKNAGELAVERAFHLVGVHEQPAGSNWGGKVEDFIRFTGYDFPVYWCGCFACWVVVKLGDARIPNRIRLGYAPYITADALADRNGLEAVNVNHARAGDIGCLWGGKHIVVVTGKPVGGRVPTIEGNTTAPGKSGSQSNGGEVARNWRPISDFDAGIVARPDYS